MDSMFRAEGGPSGPPIHGLPTMQRRVVEIVDQYMRGTGEPCTSTYIARRLSLHHSTIQKHLSSLYRKGWVRTPNAPVFLARKIE